MATIEARRLLICADGLAGTVALLAGAATVVRLRTMLPGVVVTSLYSPPLYAAIFLAGVLPLVLAWLAPGAYDRWRGPLACVNRTARLLTQLFNTAQPRTRLAVERAAVARAVSFAPLHPWRALALLLMHPSVFFLQHALFVVPSWKLAFFFQAVSLAAALAFGLELRCHLQQHAQQQGHDALARPFAAAERLCAAAQSGAALVFAGSGALGEPDAPHQLTAQRAADVCSTGVEAVTTLFVFAAVCLLLLLPVAATFVFLQHVRLALEPGSTPASVGSFARSSVSATTTSSSSTSSSSSSGMASSSRADRGASGHASSSTPPSLDAAQLLSAVGASSSGGMHVPAALAALAVPACLAVAWQLAEVVTSISSNPSLCSLVD